LEGTISVAFKLNGGKVICIHDKSANWCKPGNNRSGFTVTATELGEMVKWLVRNTFITAGNCVYRQRIGIPMGTDAAPLLANLMLQHYEYRYFMENKYQNFRDCLKLSNTCRFIDDITTINDAGIFENLRHQIYPPGLDLQKINQNDRQADVMDLSIAVVNKQFVYKLYDKRHDFPFNIVTFPHLDGNISDSMSYGVFGSQILRYSENCLMYHDLIDNSKKLVVKLLSRGYSNRKLKSAFIKTVNKHKIKDKYGINQRTTISLWIDVTRHLLH
jgi:hypothetical protein